MADKTDSSAWPALLGRSAELGAIRKVLDRAAEGEASAVVVSGDAGVGKTALVQRACASADPDTWILAGSCLPLSSMTVPFLALHAAFRHAPRVDGVATPTFAVSGDGTSYVPVLVDQWIEEASALHPVVLVIDDVQWADQGTLDVLMYLIAGPARRRLAVIATMRGEHAGAQHPLRRWLADIRRLPRIEWLPLAPLDRFSTEAHITAILGAPPHQSLVHEVFDRTAGNPYLNRLLLEGLGDDARHLPANLPSDLKAAVLQSWERLSAEAQELTQILAIAGRPLRETELDSIAGTAGTAGPGAVAVLLREAADAGTLDISPGGTYWFHHPLIAEVLEGRATDENRKHWHGVFAAFHERRSAQSPEQGFQSIIAAADHHHLAGHTAEAYQWALRAADAARSLGGNSEMLRLLRRAVSYWEDLPEADESKQELWQSIRAAAEEAGAHEDELQAVEWLLSDLDHGQFPLQAAELLVRRTHLRFSTGQKFMAVEDLESAARLAATAPGSWQYALALAELAHAGAWQQDSAAAIYAERALALARPSGSPRCLSYALSAKAMVAVVGGKAEDGRKFGAEAMTAAAQARDFWGYVHAVFWHANAQHAWISTQYADLMREARFRLLSLGAPHAYVAKLASAEATSFLSVGQWRQCQAALRIALGSDPGPMGDISTRLAAARLAALQGRIKEAVAHLERAGELYALSSGFLNLDFDAIRAEVLLAAGQAGEAYVAAMVGAESPGMPPTMCEWLLPLAARALGDQLQHARDAGTPTVELELSVHDLVRRFPHVLKDTGERTKLYDQQVAALDLVYAAETGRAFQHPGNGLDWAQAADACHDVSLLWEEAYCCLQAAESLLRHGHLQRSAAAGLLRRGIALAEELQALPIRDRLGQLAAHARIPVLTLANGGRPPASYGQIPGLTPREREVLGYVVAGHTYAEIAQSLVISEKTVSSHISNLLRKTGAANRVDLAILATRTAAARPIRKQPRPL